MTIRGRSLVWLVVVFLFLAGQTCLLPKASGASTTPDDRGHAHSAQSSVPAPSSSDGHNHEHGPGVSAHCVDSAVGHVVTPRAPVAATILAASAATVHLPRVAVRTFDAPVDVGGPPLFLLHASLLI